jgi:zinc transporter ZupT
MRLENTLKRVQNRTALDRIPSVAAGFLFYLLLLLLFTAIGFAPGGSSPTLVQTKTIKQHYTVVQHNTIKRKHNT